MTIAKLKTCHPCGSPDPQTGPPYGFNGGAMQIVYVYSSEIRSAGDLLCKQKRHSGYYVPEKEPEVNS